MKRYSQWDSKRQKYYTNWRCMECGRLNNLRASAIRRRRARMHRIFNTVPPY